MSTVAVWRARGATLAGGEVGQPGQSGQIQVGVALEAGRFEEVAHLSEALSKAAGVLSELVAGPFVSGEEDDAHGQGSRRDARCLALKASRAGKDMPRVLAEALDASPQVTERYEGHILVSLGSSG